MIKKLVYSIFAIIGMMAMNACSSPSDASGISLEKMHGFPSENVDFLKGVSALYAGVVNGNLLIAGGCNFPDVPAADGGKKVYYRDVYVASLGDDTELHWQKVGELPEASAYGVTITVDNGLVCVGGNTVEHSLSDVIRLSLQEGALQTDTLPSLPVTIDNMAGALCGNVIYIVGGNVNGIPSSAAYSLNLSNLPAGWEQLPSVPGAPRVQPICASQGGKLYVWGGFAAPYGECEASLSVDGYVYNAETNEWISVATPCDKAGNEVSLGGGAAVPYGDGQILCIGGVNKDIFLKALQGIYKGKEYLSHPAEWYQFNRNLMLYSPQTDEWTTLGEYEQGARAGAALVSQEDTYYIINGELKPGIRTNEITRIKENRR